MATIGSANRYYMGAYMSASKLNTPFVQWKNPDGIKALRKLTRANSMASVLFQWMVQYMDEENCLVASQKVIGEAIGAHPKTVSKAVAYLKAHKYIFVYKSGMSNVYTLNADIVWKGKGDDHAIFEMRGTVLLGKDEQDEKEPEKKPFRVVK